MSRMEKDTSAVDVNLRGVLEKKHYSIDYYQREYAWEEKQVTDLLDDLFIKFSGSYSAGDEKNYSIVKNYRQYFLGSFVLSQKDGSDYIIDGQQRLTTLTLIYLYICRRSLGRNTDLFNEASDFIYSTDFGKKSFNISVEDRLESMNLLLNGDIEEIGESSETSSLLNNYLEIQKYLDPRLSSEEQLSLFFYWLSERVLMVKIVAYDDNEAYTIFESMNDRGKPLRNIDMLKGYLLSLIEENREESTEIWRSIEEDLGDNFENFIISLFRAKWTETAYKKKDDALKNDWLEINKHIHRWLKENKDRKNVNMKTSQDVVLFISEMKYYSGLYKKLQDYQAEIRVGYEDLSYLKFQGFPNIEILFFALIQHNDSKEDRKIKAISKFMSLRLAIQSWDGIDSTDETNLADYTVGFLKRVRSEKDTDEINGLIWFLYEELQSKFKGNWFDHKNSPVLRSKNKKKILGILSILTARLEVASGRSNPLPEYYQKKYEIEHILASNYEVNSKVFGSQEELDSVRDSIGALGILDKRTNSSLSDEPYEKKVEKYPVHNKLLGTLSKTMYRTEDSSGDNIFLNMPALNNFFKNNKSIKEAVTPYSKFSGKEIMERNVLYSEICKEIWNIEDFISYTDRGINDIEGLRDYVGASFKEDEEEDSPSFQIPTRAEGKLYSKGTILFMKAQGKGRVVQVKGEVVDNNMISITYIKNGILKSKFVADGKKNFGKKYASLYHEIMRNADIDGEYYNWAGRTRPVTIDTPLELVNGGKLKDNSKFSWEEYDLSDSV